MSRRLDLSAFLIAAVIVVAAAAVLADGGGSASGKAIAVRTNGSVCLAEEPMRIRIELGDSGLSCLSATSISLLLPEGLPSKPTGWDCVEVPAAGDRTAQRCSREGRAFTAETQAG